MKSSIITRFVTTAILSSQAFIGTIALQELAVRHHVLQSNYAAQAQENDSEDASHLYRKLKPSIVYIEVETEKGTSRGSGVIIEKNGTILTNAHVVANAKSIMVELSDGRKLRAKVMSIGHSNCLDLAAIKVTTLSPLPFVTLANSTVLNPGQTVLAMGFPLGIKPVSITRGNISTLDENRGFITFSAGTSPGSSGGGIFNSQGQLIGIHKGKYTRSDSMYIAIDTTRVQSFLRAREQGLSPTLAQYIDLNSGGARELNTTRTPIEDRLVGRDQKFCSDGSVAHIYRFQGQAKQSILLSMESETFNPYLILLGPDGKELGFSKINSNETTAQLTLELPTEGTYTLIANTQKPNQFGRYRLQATSSNTTAVRP